MLSWALARPVSTPRRPLQGQGCAGLAPSDAHLSPESHTRGRRGLLPAVTRALWRSRNEVFPR